MFDVWEEMMSQDNSHEWEKRPSVLSKEAKDRAKLMRRLERRDERQAFDEIREQVTRTTFSKTK